MTEFNVRYRLYASNGSTLIYTFPYVQEDNSPQDPKDYVEISGLRGTGSVIIPGSTQAWDLTLGFILTAADYEALIALMDALETTIVMHTAYVLKIDRTSGGSTKDYNVKRLQPIQFNTGFRTDWQDVKITLRVNSW
jgi:hypothetical protein